VVLAAQDVRDAELGVIDDRGEEIERRPVGADQDRVLEMATVELLAALNEVGPADRPALDPEAPGALLLVGAPGLGEPGARRLVAVEPRRLAQLPIPVEPEPAEILLDRGGELLGRARGVGVVEAEDQRAAAFAREEPVDERRAGVAEMEAPRRARGEAQDRAQARNPFVIG
jgi:hypothetical protein